MPQQLPVERNLIRQCGVCSGSHDARAVGSYDMERNILYQADGHDGRHEWVADVRVWLSTPEQRAEARRQGFDIEPWDS